MKRITWKNGKINMAQCYYYFENIPFAYDNTWGTLIGPSRGVIFSFRVENIKSFTKLLDRIINYCFLNKESPNFFLSNDEHEQDALKRVSWTSSLSMCICLFPIKEERYFDNDTEIIRPVFLYIRCASMYFKLVITYGDYLLASDLFAGQTDRDDYFEISFNLDLKRIREDGSVYLTEDLVHDGGSFKVFLKKGDEHIHNRPHVQCKMDGEMYNISIDDKIEYLGKTPKKMNNVNFLIKQINSKTILQKARAIWNSVPSNYKFVLNSNGEYVTKA